MLSIPVDRLRSEIDQVFAIVSGLKERLDAGVPGDELPASDENQQVFQFQLRGELILASQRLSTLADLLGIALGLLQ